MRINMSARVIMTNANSIKNLTIILGGVIVFSFMGCRSLEKTAFIAKGCCPTCEGYILKSIEGDFVNSAEWDQFSEILTVRYFSDKISPEQLQLKISGAGYDTDLFTAPDSIYLALPKCCQYRD